MFLSVCVANLNIYRITKTTIETPMIASTKAPTVPPTVTGRLPFDEGDELILSETSGQR